MSNFIKNLWQQIKMDITLKWTKSQVQTSADEKRAGGSWKCKEEWKKGPQKVLWVEVNHTVDEGMWEFEANAKLAFRSDRQIMHWQMHTLQ